MNEPAFTVHLNPGQVHHFVAELRKLGFPDSALAGATLKEDQGVVLRFQTVPRIGGAVAFFFIDKKPEDLPSGLVYLMVEELLGE
jgi:hypothetical protein